MARRPGGLLGRALERVESVTGFAVVDANELRVQEAVSREAYYMANDLEELGYIAMNYASGRPSEPTAASRRKWAQQARVVWLADPLAGAATEMLNEFSLGRGVPRPRAKDKKVQEKIDEAWDDPQNQRVLTSFVAQTKFGNSLSIQSNVFFLLFDDGEDGKVTLSFLNHDTVEGTYTDPENRQRVLFYLATETTDEWDFGTDSVKLGTTTVTKPLYYEAWGAVVEALIDRGFKPKDAEDKLVEIRKQIVTGKSKGPEKPIIVEGPHGDKLELPPPSRWGAGKVYHVAENRDMEMIFGVPRMRRTIRWYTSLNDYMASRVNMMQAASSFIAKKTVKGPPGALERLASKAMRSSSDLRSTIENAINPEGVKPGPRPGAIASVTDNVNFEPLKLSSGSGEAQTDAQMLRSQISAGDRWPQHYLGDATTANLATATSIELPVLKHVESRQELLEGVFRWFLDRVISRAVEAKQLDPNTREEEDEAQLVRTVNMNPEVEEATVTVVDMVWRINKKDAMRPTEVYVYPSGNVEYRLREAHEEKAQDEKDTGRDLSYEFGMPSPLRRMMSDLVGAATQTAQMADPNGENVELTRTLLMLILSEGFEMQDASDVVDRIFPKGYVPLAVQAMQAQMDQQAQPGVPAPPGTPRAGGDQQPPGATDVPPDETNPYGAPAEATAPENVPGAQEALREAAHVPTMLVGRNGGIISIPGARATRPSRAVGAGAEFEREARVATVGEIAKLDMDRIGDQ